MTTTPVFLNTLEKGKQVYNQLHQDVQKLKNKLTENADKRYKFGKFLNDKED